MIIHPRLVFVAALTTCLALRWAQSHTPGPAPSEPSWVRGGAYRLRIGVFRGEQIGAEPVQVAATHGDMVAVGLRPGYPDPQGNTSEGARGLATGDNGHATNTDAIATAMGELKRRSHARKVVVAGHAGGAAIAANLLGRHPEVIDAARLVSCPCDVEQWRQHMFQLTGLSVFQGMIDTLSPSEQITGLSDQAQVTLMVGSPDQATPPGLSERYQAVAATLYKQVRLGQLEGKGHEIFLELAGFAALAQLLT
jgi:predicted esterase